LRRFRTSLAFTAGLVCLHLVHHRLFNWLVSSGHAPLAEYVVIGLAAAAVGILVVKTVGRGFDLETAAAVCIGLIVFFFLLSRPRIQFKFKILEFFVFGIVLALENRRVRSFMPLLLVPVAAILSALAVHLVLGRGIYFMEMWLNGLFAMSGYVYGAVWRRL
jgi:hypothetical protein